MLSLLRSRCSGSFCAIYRINVKYAHRSSGGRQRGHQQLFSGHGNEDWGNEMAEDAEEIEDLQTWFEANVARPEFQQIVVSEEEKLKKTIAHKIIERKYYKKPQAIGLLTWDAKEQIRFLHNEYPNEWTIDRLAESFPADREGIIKILKSRFQPKTLAEIIKHDERVQRRWKELQDGKTKGKLASGPVTSRYQELLKTAAGNPSLPKPDVNRLLLASGRERRETVETGAFLSIVKDYCEQKQEATDASAVKQVKAKRSDQRNLLEDHLAQNRKLVEGVIEMSPKHFAGDRKPIKSLIEQSPNHHSESRKQATDMVTQSQNYFKGNRKLLKGIIEQSPKHSEVKRTDLYKTLENEKHSFGDYLNKSATQTMNRDVRSKQLIDSDFESSIRENEKHNSKDLVSVAPQRQGINSLRRRSMNDDIADEETNGLGDQITDGGIQGTKKLGASNDVLKKMEANSRLAREVNKRGSRHAVDSRSKETLRNMKDEDSEEGTETYIFNEGKGYQHPFGQRKDLPEKRIPVPRNKLKSGVEFQKGNDFYDEDGEFLYRTP